jgi:hypothetical protein
MLRPVDQAPGMQLGNEDARGDGWIGRHHGSCFLVASRIEGRGPTGIVRAMKRRAGLAGVALSVWAAGHQLVMSAHRRSAARAAAACRRRPPPPIRPHRAQAGLGGGQGVGRVMSFESIWTIRTSRVRAAAHPAGAASRRTRRTSRTAAHSVALPRAIAKKRARSALATRPAPSAMLRTMELEARSSWSRRSADPRAGANWGTKPRNSRATR